MAEAFCQLTPYRDGAVYLAHWAGKSPWEVHYNGDEIVLIVEGETQLTLLVEGKEISQKMHAGEMMVVPERVWHRLESVDGVKLLSVTPQPTDHSIETPNE